MMRQLGGTVARASGAEVRPRVSRRFTQSSLASPKLDPTRLKLVFALGLSDTLTVTTPPGEADLGLARASGPAVRGGGHACGLAVSRGMHTLGEPAPCFTDRRYLLILHLDQSASCSTAALGHRLFVSRKVEQDEEEEVRRDDADTGDGGKLLAGAFAHVGKVRPVGAGEVGPGSEVNEACEQVVNGLPSTRDRANSPRSRTNWMICIMVMYFFHQILIPRALWK